MHNRLSMLGYKIDFIQPAELLRRIAQHKGTPLKIVLINPHTIMSARRNIEIDKAIRSADYRLPDGVGIVLAAKLLGMKNAFRLPGPDFMLYCCSGASEQDLCHYFHGGKPKVAEQLIENLSVRHPNLRVAGFDSPPFASGQSPLEVEHCSSITQTNPDIVWVGLGSPKQELWLERNAGQIKARAVVGIGAAFDFYGGTIKRAPRLLQHLGLEWLYRLLKEPGRLWKRNLDSFKFASLVLCQKVWGATQP